MRPRSVAIIGVLALFWAGLVLRGVATSGASGGADGPDGPSGSSGQWTPAGTLSQARAGGAAVLLDDGRLLVTGGIAATGDGTVGAVSAADLYASSAGFSAAAAMTVARSGHSAVTLEDGRVLVAGGSASANPADPALASAEIYDPAAATWTPVGGLADARSGHTASLLNDGRVLIAGGASAGVARASLEIFDPATLRFSTTHAVATARREHAATILADGRVLLAGGTNDAGVLATIEIYDPVADTIVSAAMSGPRTGASATRLLDGKVLIAGGNDGTQDLTTAEVFDPTTGTSVVVAPMATARRGHQAFLLPNNNSVLLVGGTSTGVPLAAAELFIPGAMAFTATGSLTDARLQTSGDALLDEGRLVVAGGANGTGLLASAERYSFATVTTDRDDYAPGETVTITGEGWEPGETVTLRLHEAVNPQIHDDLVYSAVADSAGRIYDNEFAPDLDDVGVRFYLTATGARSQALNTFTDGELLTAEVVGTANDVTVAQGATANFTIQVSATGAIECTATAATPATATVRTVFSLSSSGALSSSTPSAPLAFFAGAPQGGQNCAMNWTGAPTPYNVAASVSAASTTPIGTYTIVLSAPAGTTTVSTPPGQGANLADATATNITVHVTAPADSTPPVITPTVTGTAGSNGWYVSDVTVSWSVTDPESSISSSTGCTTSTVTTDTTGVTFTCTATSTGGTSTKSVTVKRDTTPPSAALSVTAGTLGAHGWYTSDVTVHTAGTDTISSPVVCTADQHVTTETTGTPFNGSCTNDAGLTTNAAPLTVKLDKTGPTATLAVSAGTAGTNGWYTSDVMVHASGTDTISGPVTCTADQQLTTETTGTAFNGSCTNDAGLTTNATPLTVKLDKTGPTGVTTTVTAGTLGAHGWYTSDVTIHTTGTDSISSPVTCSADQHLTTETAGTPFNGSCTNDAGLTTNAAPLTIKLDKTGPTADLTVTAGTAGANGWYTSDVTVHAAGTDSVSTPVTCTADQHQTTETAGTPFNGSCTNDAGLSTNATPLTVKLDKTGPTGVTSTVTAGTLGAHGWYISDVTVHTVGTDDISGPVQCTADQLLTTDTAGQAVDASCTNRAGLTTNAASLTVKLDKTGPTADLTVTGGTAGTNGWYTSDVTVHANGTDSVSSPVTCTADQHQTTETAGTPFNGSCTNDAGLTTNAASLTIKLDKTGPTAGMTVTSGTAGAHGWYISDVTIQTAGSDTISNPVTCSADQQQTTETTGTPFSGSCTNDAGLTTNAAPLTIKLDKTGPTADLTVTGGTAGANGWYTSDVTVHANGTDTISNPVTCTADQHQTTETAGTPFNGSCTNDAGLSTNAAPLTVKLDKTGPTAVASSVTTGTLGAHGWYISDVTIHTVGTDDVSGPVQCTADQMLTSDTTGQAVNASCTNQAGLSTNAAPLTVKLDKTGPTADLTVTGGTAGTNGWYTSDVTVHAAGTDSVSSPVTCTADQHQTTETAGTPFNGSCTNDAGLTTNATPLTVKLDKTGPTGVVSTVTAGTAGAHGWYISDVTVHTVGTDDLSGPVTCTADQLLTIETTGQAVDASCTNQAGLTTNAAPLTVKLDKTAPSAALTVTNGTAGTNGWYISDVTVHASGTDSISNPVTCTADQQQTTETAGTPFNGSCTNDAGLTTNAAPLTIKVDKTGPSADMTVAGGTAGAHGWYISDVTIHTTGSDTLSNPVTCTGDQQQTTETAGTPFSGSCTNDAGLMTNAAPLTIKVDKTAPSAALSVTAGTAGANGWFTSDVTIHASGTDTVSNPVVCTADQHQTAETAGTPFNGSCTNDAGLTTPAAPLTVKLDKTGPTGVASTVVAGTAGAHGWYISDVSVHTVGSEDLSGPVTCTSDQTLSADTAGQSVDASCTNQAGLTTNAASLTIKLDKTAPSAALSVTGGTAGANGWFTSDVTIHASGTDNVSNPVVCTADQHQTAETTGASFGGSCVNDAGLTTNAAPLVVKLDKTAPSAVLSATGTAGLNGWFVGDVTVNTNGSDAISSPVVCTGVQSQTTDTSGATFNGSCTNNAGLTANATPLVVKLDKTPPVISVSAPSNGGIYVLNASVPAAYGCTDATSGPASCSGPVANGANFSTAGTGSHSFTVTAKDNAGNTATLTTSYGIRFATGLCLGAAARTVLQPINTDGTSVFKQKSTVPVKFRVCDANGVSIGSGVVSDFRLVQIVAGTAVSTVNEAVDSTTPDATFRFDPTDQQWIFNTNTKSMSASMTYGFLITLTDSTTIQYQFGLK